MAESTAWWSYDGVAETYDRLAVPHLFTQPAKDLVALLKLPPGARVLDLGAGTGVATVRALQSAGPGAVVVGLDASLGMLRLARRKGLPWLVAGAIPGLPFSEAVFSGVMASFLLSHVPSYREALSDMVRVLRPGGWLGLTAWGADRSEPHERWKAAAELFADKEALGHGVRQALPWEEWLAVPTHLEEALRDAGLDGIEVHRREYRSSLPVDDFLAMKEISLSARLMQELLDSAQWESFRKVVREEFHSRWGGLVEDTRSAYLAVGVKLTT